MSIFKKNKTVKAENSKNENPYLNARREWNAHTGAVVSSRQTWQIIGILSLLIALAGVGGVVHIGSQSKFIPYVVEVDKLGQTRAAGVVQSTSRVDQRIIHATVVDFIIKARTVTPDASLQKSGILWVYAHLSPRDPAMQKMNEFLNGNPDQNPFKRAATEMVNIEIKSAIPQSEQTWQVDWLETTRDRKGALSAPPRMHRALLSVYNAKTDGTPDDETIRLNPLAVYVSDFSWSRLTN